MSTFNEADHPRGHHSNPGAFSAKTQTVAEIALHPDDLTEISFSESALAEAATVDDRRIDFQVELRSGERELSDAVALAIAGRLARGDRPALSRLAEGQPVSRSELMDDLSAVYASESSGRTRDRVNMMFTWVLHGGDNS